MLQKETDSKHNLILPFKSIQNTYALQKETTN